VLEIIPVQYNIEDTFMGVHYKTKEEIELIRHSSLLVGKTLAEVAKLIKPGVTSLELDKIAEEFIRDNGGIPTFLGYNGFPGSLCVSVNECVVHGIPNSVPLQNGDVISVDCGVFKNGFNGDSAYTFQVGEVDRQVQQLLRVTQECLDKAIEACKVGNRIGDIGNACQKHAESFGYGVVRELVGHGLGASLHEAPEVPNYGKAGRGLKLREGLVLAIEPMINLGVKEIDQLNDGWSIVTQDGLPSAHFEHDVAIVDGKPEVLSTFKYIEEVLKERK
jgi:methionyl aminopeptidase|tara:strand:- start:8998 stop:9825 length:828 start_codon:yes stop_codon:yes gene_type:complete